MTEAWIAQDILDLAAASAGGTMGVMGTVLALELKKTEVMKRSEVRYSTLCQPDHKKWCALIDLLFFFLLVFLFTQNLLEIKWSILSHSSLPVGI